MLPPYITTVNQLLKSGTAQCAYTVLCHFITHLNSWPDTTIKIKIYSIITNSSLILLLYRHIHSYLQHPKPQQPLTWSLILLRLLHTRSIRYVTSGDWLFLLHIMPLKSIQIVCVNRFLVFYCWVVFQGMNVSQFL